MTSLFQVIAHEDANDQSKLRQASALAHQRVEDRFGTFVRRGSIEDQGARYSLVEEDIRAVVAAACQQVGFADVDGILTSIGKNFISEPEARKVSSTIHESRKPKMCPYHSEVTDISLAQGEPQAGYNAMSSHAWSAKHCQGEDYEGDRCKFKPAMTTQSYWDERANTLDQRRQERAERAEQQALEPQMMGVDIPEVETPTEEVAEPVAEVAEIHEHSEPSAIGEGVSEVPEEVPMAMAAKVSSESVCPKCSATSFDGVCSNSKCSESHKSESSTKTAETATPIPKMDKRKWTLKTTPELHEDEKDGPHPTKRKDVTEPIKQDQGTRFEPSALEEIGDQETERQDVTKKVDDITGEGGSFGGGERSAVSSLLDPNKVREALSKFKR